MNPLKHLNAIHRRLPPPLTGLPLLAGLDMARRLHYLQIPAELEGRRFAITLQDFGIRAHFQCCNGRFRPLWQGLPELELAASSLDFFRMLSSSQDADTLFFQRKLTIQGDTELGLLVKNWLDASERPAWLLKLGNYLTDITQPN